MWRFVGASGLAVAVFGGYLGVAAPAHGQNFSFQMGPEGEEGAESPPIGRKQFEGYASLLGLDEDQVEAALALFDGMQAEWNALSAKTKEEVESIREEFEQDRDPSVFAERMPQVMRKQGEARRRLVDGLMGDLSSLMSEDQAARWPLVERAHRRDTTLNRGRLGGESVDLLGIVAEVGLAPVPAEVKALMEQYETDLDRALVTRNDIIDQAQQFTRGAGGLADALQNEEFQKLREQARKARLRIREVNESYARQIAAVLPESQAAKFNKIVTERSYPEAFRPSHTEASLKAALAFDDLTTDQRQALETSLDSYARERERLTRKWIDSAREFESTPEGYTAALMGGMGGLMFNSDRAGGPGRPGGTETNPVAEVRNERRDLDVQTFEALKGLLSDGQRERLPKRRERGMARGLGGGQGGMVFQGDIGDGGDTTVVIRSMDGEPPPLPPPGEGGTMIIRRVEVGPDGETTEDTEVISVPPGHMPVPPPVPADDEDEEDADEPEPE